MADSENLRATGRWYFIKNIQKLWSPSYDGLCDYLLSRSFFSPQQHVFRKGWITHLLTSVNRWTTIRNNERKVSVINLDFSKVFNGTSDTCLINKFKMLGIKSPAIDLPTLYLNNQLFWSHSTTFSSGFGVSWWGPQWFSTRTSSFPYSHRQSFTAGIFRFITFHRW